MLKKFLSMFKKNKNIVIENDKNQLISNDKCLDDKYVDNEPINNEQQLLLDFLEGKGEDIYGRTLQSILERDSREWFEFTHNYIQWLFPLREASNFAYSIPLTNKMIEYIKNNETILENIKKSFEKMLIFYGFALEEDNILIFETKQEMINNWLNIGNHNFLRITRILGCLSIVGYTDLARKWFNKLEYISKDLDYIDKTNSKEYWENALTLK